MAPHEGRLLFVNKKKQKNFAHLGRAGFTATGPKEQKFLRRFFQKAATFFGLNQSKIIMLLGRIDIQRIQIILLAS
jgi:hypothetical protein